MQKYSLVYFLLLIVCSCQPNNAKIEETTEPIPAMKCPEFWDYFQKKVKIEPDSFSTLKGTAAFFDWALDKEICWYDLTFSEVTATLGKSTFIIPHKKDVNTPFHILYFCQVEEGKILKSNKVAMYLFFNQDSLVNCMLYGGDYRAGCKLIINEIESN